MLINIIFMYKAKNEIINFPFFKYLFFTAIFLNKINRIFLSFSLPFPLFKKIRNSLKQKVQQEQQEQNHHHHQRA